MKSLHINIGAYVLTLAAAAVYLWRAAPAGVHSYITGGVLMVALLILLSINGWTRSFGRCVPLYTFFWAALYVLLPSGAVFNFRRIGTAFDAMWQGFTGSLGIALPALVLTVVFGIFVKNHKSVVLSFIRYIAGGALIYFINDGVAKTFALSPIVRNAMFLVPFTIGVFCLCSELNRQFKHQEKGCFGIFIFSSLAYELLAGLVFNVGENGAYDRLVKLADFTPWKWIVLIMALCGGLVLFETLSIEKDNPEKEGPAGMTHQYCLLFLFVVLLFVCKLLLPKCMNSFVMASGVALANVAYTYYCKKQLNRTAEPPAISFDWKVWSLFAIALVALGGLVNSNLFMLIPIAALIFGYVICLKVSTTNGSNTVLLCYAGVAVVAIRYILAVRGLDVNQLIVTLLLGAFWCVLCAFLKKSASAKKEINPDEYKLTLNISKYIPAALFVFAAISFIVTI